MRDTEISHQAAPDFSGISAETLIVRLAKTPEDLLAAQKLRYHVFYEELGAVPTPDMATHKKDWDAYDAFCDHILVIDTQDPSSAMDAASQQTVVHDGKVIGTYRVLLADAAKKAAIPLYTQTEFDLSKLLQTPGVRVMETSRSCVFLPYRNGIIVSMLWQAISTYAFHYQVSHLIGIPSFHGTAVAPYMDALASLHAYSKAPAVICPTPLRTLRMPLEAHEIAIPNTPLLQPTDHDAVPALIKGYLKLGAQIGDGVVIDHQFNTVDLCIIVDITNQKNTLVSYFRKKYERHLQIQAI